MQDYIFIEDLRVDCVIGVFDWERKIKQPLLISLHLPCEARTAALTDNIGATLDYKAVSKSIIELAENSQCNLLETLAEQIAALCLSKFHVEWVRVKLDKPGALRGSRTVGVQIFRQA